ncbi:GntR family transcriptional regulator [Halobacillus amylolyticus]|uniref:GntR family transcriptional regulator n=1 Tax=Halobacillus amylolyticus TaxID=2932259 RepID=A0ABY4HJC6_9BACI|nr:GntR family transcriptional regulator [Halobacillus amylolyticus]UOR13580.1 GntR family transcriptional regulator [Halobacillus amylolyticus]
MKPPNLNHNALSNHIAEHITEQIITGELQPGEKIVENTYATEYGTSRAPVREAIYLLTIEGLVERIPRRGAVVKEHTENEIYDLLEIRIMLESLAMKRIKENGIDEEILGKMGTLYQEMSGEKDIQRYTQLNHKFHLCLIEMSKSETINKMYTRLELPLLRVQTISFAAEGNVEKSVREHLTLVDLLKEGNIEEATTVLQQHNQDVITSIQKRLFDYQSKDSQYDVY